MTAFKSFAAAADLAELFVHQNGSLNGLSSGSRAALVTKRFFRRLGGSCTSAGAESEAARTMVDLAVAEARAAMRHGTDGSEPGATECGLSWP